MNRMLRSLVALSALLLVVGQARADVTVYSQTDNQWGGYTSQHNTSVAPSSYFTPGDTATVYDNFTLGSSASITSVGWIGSYYDGPPQPINPDGSYGYGSAAPGTISGFTLNFWANVVDGVTGINRPDYLGTPLLTLAVSGNAGETYLGYADLETTYYGPNDRYGYGLSLATPFAATGGTTYWLSIIADSAFAPEWGWATAGLNGYNTGPDGPYYDPAVSLSYRQDTSGGTLKRNISGGDFAFSLAAIPEPATMSLLALGGLALSGLVSIRKRK